MPSHFSNFDHHFNNFLLDVTSSPVHPSVELPNRFEKHEHEKQKYCTMLTAVALQRKSESTAHVRMCQCGNENYTNVLERSIAVDFIEVICVALEFSQATLHLTMHILDSYMATKTMPRRKWRVAVISALHAASKFVENNSIGLATLLNYLKWPIQEQVIQMEVEILATIEWNLVVMSPVHFLGFFMEIISKRIHETQGSDGHHSQSHYRSHQMFSTSILSLHSRNSTPHSHGDVISQVSHVSDERLQPSSGFQQPLNSETSKFCTDTSDYGRELNETDYFEAELDDMDWIASEWGANPPLETNRDREISTYSHSSNFDNISNQRNTLRESYEDEPDDMDLLADEDIDDLDDEELQGAISTPTARSGHDPETCKDDQCLCLTDRAHILRSTEHLLANYFTKDGELEEIRLYAEVCLSVALKDLSFSTNMGPDMIAASALLVAVTRVSELRPKPLISRDDILAMTAIKWDDVKECVATLAQRFPKDRFWLTE